MVLKMNKEIILLIPILFYGYKLITKKSILIIDITIFYVAIIFSVLIFKYIVNIEPLHFFYRYISVVILFIIFGFYMVLTLLPIKNFLLYVNVISAPSSKLFKSRFPIFPIKGHSHLHNTEDK